MKVQGCGEAGRERRQAQGQGAQGRLRPPRHRPVGRGHEGAEDDRRGHRGPRRRCQQAAQALPRRADRLRRPGQGGEEGRQEGRRRRQEGRWRQERGRQEGRRRQERRGQEGRRQEAAGGEAGRAGVPALLVPDAAAAALHRPQRRGGPQLVRHLLIDADAPPPPPIPCRFRRCPVLSVLLCRRRRRRWLVVAVLISLPAAAIDGVRYTYVYDREITSCTASIGAVWLIFGKISL